MAALLATIFLMAFVFLFGLFLVFIATRLLSPKTKMDNVKFQTYECGLPEETTGKSKVPIKFYLTAILFILFDIEIIFMYPWAVSFIDFVNNGDGLYVLTVMGIFLLVFIYGLFWEIKSHALEWE